MTMTQTPRAPEIPEVLRPFAVQFAQRGERVIYRYSEDREVRPELLKWPVVGLEFADATVARTADYHHHRFGLHHFTSWDEGSEWIAGRGGHEPWRDCPDCSEINALYAKWWEDEHE